MILRRKIIIISIVALCIIAGAIYFCYDPSKSQFFPRCLFLQFTGYKCPGCGSQRAIHALLHFNIGAAWHENAMLVLSIPLVITYIVGDFLRTSRQKFYTTINSPIVIISIGIVFLLWWLLRNIFGW